MTLIDLTYLVIQLTHLVDYDLHRDVTIDEAEKAIEDGVLFSWLEKRFEGHIDLSIYRGRPHAQEILSELQALLSGYRGDEQRKWGVRHNGICLLIVWINELVQQKKWKETGW